VIVVGAALLGICISIADKRSTPANAKNGEAKPSEPATIKTQQHHSTRSPDGRFRSRSQESAAQPPRATRDPWRVTEAEFKSRGSPDVENFILNSRAPTWEDVESPLDVLLIESVAQMRIESERQKSIINRTGWSMAGGAALMLMFTGSRVWLLMAFPGIIALATICVNVLSGRAALTKISLESTSLTSTEKGWVDKVEEYLKQRH